MLCRKVVNFGVAKALSRDAAFLSGPSRIASIAMNSTQAASGSEAPVKLEFDSSNGTPITGSAVISGVRQQSAAVEEGTQFIIGRCAVDAMLKEYDGVVEESKDWKDKYTRSLAETENVRRRGIAQVEKTKEFAVQGFCKDLLEVADILDLAVASVKQADLKDATPAMKSLYDGLSMTKQVLMSTFGKHGLRPNNPIGEKFDPNLHEAVFQVPKEATKCDIGHVAEVMKIGYLLKERPIRAAQVGVVKE